MKTPHELKQSIMRRVYGTFAVRQMSRPTVRIGALLILLLSLRELTFVTKVLENAFLKENFFEVAGYFVQAFIGTEFVVQAVTVGVVVLAVFIAKDATTIVRPQYLAVR